MQLQFSKRRANYVTTKKIHPKQVETWLPDGSLRLDLFVELNPELEARLLEFGKDVTVLAPEPLQIRTREILQEALANYKNL